MLCKDVQMEISVGSELTEGMIKHIDLCSDCKCFSQLEQKVIESCSPWRNSLPSLLLEGKVRDSVRQSTRTPRVRPRLMVFGQLAAAAAAIAVGVALFSPHTTKPRSVSGALGRVALIFTGGGAAEADIIAMSTQVSRAQHAHLSVWSAEYLKPLGLMEQDWWAPGFLRKTASPSMGGDRLFKRVGGRLIYTAYRPELGKVISSEEDAPQVFFGKLESLSLENLINVYNEGVKDLKVGPERRKGNTLEVIGSSDDEYHRYVFTLDAATRLPLQLLMEHHENGEWLPYMRLDFDFTSAVPASKFDESNLIPRNAP